MEELEIREEIWGPARGLWVESCQGLAATGQDGGAEGWGGDLESGEGFVWVSPARGCRGGPTTALMLLTWGFPKPC